MRTTRVQREELRGTHALEVDEVVDDDVRRRPERSRAACNFGIDVDSVRLSASDKPLDEELSVGPEDDEEVGELARGAARAVRGMMRGGPP